jgi:tetratricopeptide (TPR) repeat protein
MNVVEALAQAFSLHQLGALAEAEPLYRAILDCEPANADAWHLLGVAMHQQGRHSDAAESIARAVAIVPANATFLCHLGAAHGAAGRLADAEAAFRAALAVAPNDAQAWYNLGAALGKLARTDEAIAAYQRAIDARPDFVQALYNLGNALRDTGRADEAIRAFQQAIRFEPNYVEALNNLGGLLQSQGRLDEATQVLVRALGLQPNYALAKNNLGEVLRDQGRLDEARAQLEQAVALEPNLAEAHNNLGTVLHRQRHSEQAIESFRRALTLRPDYLRAKYNLGAVQADLRELDKAIATFHEVLGVDPDSAEAANGLGGALVHRGQPAEALPWIERSLQLKPNYAEAHQNRAVVWLLQGDFQRGWPEFEWRRKLKDCAPAGCLPRPWAGQAMPGATLLLFAEQGLGDTLQFVRFALDARERVGKVILVCQPPLVNLLQRGCAGLDGVVPQGAPLPASDVQAPLMSLPGLLGATADSLAARTPSIRPAAELAAAWRTRLASTEGLKVGIAWQGNPQYPDDRFRSIPLEHFAPLTRIEGVTLFSLQKGFGSEQLAELLEPLPVVDLGPELDGAAGAFMDTAAVMVQLDLVITSDTAVAHLAGALGVPVWVALAHVSEWRWLVDRDESPWYPSMRLFRQTATGDWPGVFARMADNLANLAARERSPR